MTLATKKSCNSDQRFNLSISSREHVSILVYQVLAYIILKINNGKHTHVNRIGQRLCWSSTREKGDRDGHDEGITEVKLE